MAVRRALASDEYRLVLGLSEIVMRRVRKSRAGWTASSSLRDLSRSYGLRDLTALLARPEFRTVRAGPVLGQHDADPVLRLESTALERGWAPGASLLSYWIVDFFPNLELDLKAHEVADLFCREIYTGKMPSIAEMAARPGQFDRHPKVRPRSKAIPKRRTRPRERAKARRPARRAPPGRRRLGIEHLETAGADSMFDFCAGPVVPRDRTRSRAATHCWPCEKYLNAAPQGIGARAVWNVGYRGEGMGCVDIESSWRFSDPEIRVMKKTSLIYNKCHPDADCRAHGTNTLGVLAGRGRALRNRAPGIMGVAPCLESLKTASMYRPRDQWGAADEWDIVGAIVEGTLQLNEGDVLLLEIHSPENGTYLPIEFVAPVFDAIRVAVGNGIVVVEAAGNGGSDLDEDPVGTQYEGGRGPRLKRPGKRPKKDEASGWLRRKTAEHGAPEDEDDLNDSGAILVGACNAGSRTWNGRTNFGSRVDCYAWGTRIRGVGHPPRDCADRDNPEMTRWNDFHYGLTSGASAILAGVAVLTQQMAKSKLGRPLSPFEMRGLLSCPDLGTPPAADPDHKIGVMPNLEKIRDLII